MNKELYDLIGGRSVELLLYDAGAPMQVALCVHS